MDLSATTTVTRRRRHRFTRSDWRGDCIVTVALAAVVTVGVVLPWANVDTGHQVNLSLTKPETIRPALGTGWGVAVLALGLGVFAVGLLLLALGARRVALPAGAAVSVAGVAIVVLGFRAAAAMAGWYTPGLGLYIDVLAGIVLVPTGFTVAVVGSLLAGERKESLPRPS